MRNKIKTQRFILESEIITIVFEDNRNTVHFDYHVNIDAAKDSIRLDLYTKNARNDEVFLLHKTTGGNSIEVLEKMIAYLKTSHHKEDEKNSYTVKWRNKNEAPETQHTSYFYEHSEEDVKTKFFYNKNPKDFEMSITLNPIT